MFPLCLYVCDTPPPPPLFTHVCGPPLSLSLLTNVCGVQGTVRAPVSYYQKVESTQREWGKAVATIDVSAARAFADCWCLDSYEFRMDYTKRSGSDALRKVVHIPNSHSMLVVNFVRFPSPFSNRVFATWFTWRKEPDGSFLMAFAPVEDYADQLEDGDRAVIEFMEKQQVSPPRARGYYRFWDRGVCVWHSAPLFASSVTLVYT